MVGFTKIAISAVPFPKKSLLIITSDCSPRRITPSIPFYENIQDFPSRRTIRGRIKVKLVITSF
jgi:hypothetical protein